MRTVARGVGTTIAFLLTTLLISAGDGLGSTPALVAQTPITLVGPEGRTSEAPVASHRGYAAFPVSVLEELGWTVRIGPSTVVANLEGEVVLDLRPGSPFYTWNGEVRQLVDAPYFFGERLYLPLQLLADDLPRELGEIYGWSPDARRLSVARALSTSTAPSTSSSSAARSARASPAGPRRAVVVIDPGHGGRDTGALGPAGIREKDIALGVALALQRELAGEPGLEVYLTRESDVLVPIWQRGELATQWKGDRPGIFLSLHANAAGRGSSARGFETYFLSEARTEHEMRVAALENSAISIEVDAGLTDAASPDLGFILNDLRNRDHQRWSALLADLVQEELGPVHPGPDRGVKQGPFAVITNALMPAVLVEMGFITHPDEARTLDDPTFQGAMARSLAHAVRAFFDRYPPGAEAAVPGGRR